MNTQEFYKEFGRQVDLIGLKELLEGFSLYLDKQASYYHKQAEKENNVPKGGGIGKCCRGNQKEYINYKWSYYES